MTTEKQCSDHPDAPHGFVRNASHSVGHYVCECSGWTPPTLQERLRDGADICHARNIQLDYARVATEAADRIDDLTAKLDQYRTEYFAALRERDELAADKEVLLNHMTTIRNCTTSPAIASLTRVVIERMAQGGGK